ncbi:MAG: hypothetical protein ABSG32_03970 [Terriglobia bacterium]|jgi:hypothetical protein
MRDAFRNMAAALTMVLTSSIVLLLLTMMAPVSCLPAQEATGQEALTNADVVKMVQAHLGADVIVEQIRSNSGNYSLTTDSLIRLKQQGVPDKVIAAMQAKNGTPTPATFANPSAKSTQAGGEWQIETKENQLTGRHIREAVMIEPFNDGRDSATVTATCGYDELDFQIVYTSPNKDLYFKIYNPAPTIFMGQVYSHQQRVAVRVRIDRGEVVTVAPATEYLNEATLRFIAKKDYSNDGFSALADMGAAGYRKSVYQASDVRVELPLNDGETPVIDIKPQDPSFKEFAAGCPAGSEKDTGLTYTPAGPTYTAEEFATLLPAIIRKATVAHGFNSHGYDKEVDYITAAVKTFAQITPEMAAGGQFIWRRYGQEYQICEGLDSYRHMYFRGGQFEDVSWASGNVQGTPYAIHPTRHDVGLRIFQPPGHSWTDGKGFYLSVKILESASDHGDDDRDEILLQDVHITSPIPHDRSNVSAPNPTTAAGPVGDANGQAARIGSGEPKAAQHLLSTGEGGGFGTRKQVQQGG